MCVNQKNVEIHWQKGKLSPLYETADSAKKITQNSACWISGRPPPPHTPTNPQNARACVLAEHFSFQTQIQTYSAHIIYKSCCRAHNPTWRVAGIHNWNCSVLCLATYWSLAEWNDVCKVTRQRAVWRQTYQHSRKTQILTSIPWFYANNISAKHFRFHFADQ
jgi:hypothetical protein